MPISLSDLHAAPKLNRQPQQQEPQEKQPVAPINENSPAPEPVEVEIPASTTNKIEEIARKRGWRPVDEFDGDKSQWRNAEEFLQHGDEVRGGLKKEISELKDSLAFMSRQFKDQATRVREQTIRELSEQKRAAIQAADIDKVEAIEKEIHSVRAEAEQIKQVDPSDKIVTDWRGKNKNWFNDESAENAAMSNYMRAATVQYEKDNPGCRPEVALESGEMATKKYFSHRFENPNKRRVQDVEQSQVMSTTKAKANPLDQLSAADKKVVINMAAKAKMPLDQYIKELVKAGVLTNN